MGWMFTLAIVFLGSPPPRSEVARASGPEKGRGGRGGCWASGFMIAAAGVELHLIWLLYLGYGVVGGIGLGIGYISPVSTLIKWFPDRRGMATGMAIMGFGGGALIGSSPMR